MKHLLIFLIKIYRKTISPLLPGACRFYPTCSEYSMEALKKYGAIRGFWLSVKRIAKCGPWHPGGIDKLK